MDLAEAIDRLFQAASDDEWSTIESVMLAAGLYRRDERGDTQPVGW